MKQRMLKFTPEELIRALQGKPTQHLNLFIDMELIDIKYDAFAKQVTAVIRSDSFEDAPEGMPTPEYTHKTSLPQQPSATISPVTTTVPLSTNPADVVSTENPLVISTSPVASQKLLSQTLSATPSSSSTSIGTGVKTLGSKPETNMDTCGFEDEFTKEQRKVLRFVSDGDFVIVKPIQFLKTEWEDINDTVKSIGGKWVKGGTIDYWAIPKNIKKE